MEQNLTRLEPLTSIAKATGTPIRPTRSIDETETVEFWEKQLTIGRPFESERYGIPLKFRNCTFENFRGNDPLIDGLKTEYKTGGLVLRGITGCGKTHLAVAMMKLMEERQWVDHCRGNIARIKDGKLVSYRTAPGKWFITTPDLLLEIRESFRENSEVSERTIIDRYSKIPLLVLDDLGSEKASEYALTTLYILIDHRDRELMDTIITTNLSQDQIEEKLTARIASRLAGWNNIRVEMPDYRKKGKR